MEESPEQPEEPKRELTARELVSVLVRLLALTAFLGIFQPVVNWIITLMAFTDPFGNGALSLSDWLIGFGLYVATFIFIVWLWLFPETIAERIVPDVHNGYVRFDLSFREIQALVFSLFGIMLLTRALPTLLEILADTIIHPPAFVRGSELQALSEILTRPGIFAGIMQFILAVVLLVWSQRIVKTLYLSEN